MSKKNILLAFPFSSKSDQMDNKKDPNNNNNVNVKKIQVVESVVCKPHGIYMGLQTKRASLFLIKKKKSDTVHPLFGDVSDIPIGSIDTLPSYNPWLTYVLDIKVDPNQKLEDKYQVVRIRNITRPQKVSKRSIVDFLMVKRYKFLATGSAEYTGSDHEMKERIDGQRKFFNLALRHLPTSITAITQIVTDPTFYQGDYVVNDVFNMLTVAFQPQPFYSLLRYFSEKFLLGFNRSQLIWIEAMMVANPWYFCFWNPIDRFASQSCPNRFKKNILVEKFDVKFNHYFVFEDACLRDADEMQTMSLLITRYVSYFPVLFVYKVRYFLDDYKSILSEARLLHFTQMFTFCKKAFAFYIEACKQFYIKGGNVLTLDDYNYHKDNQNRTKSKMSKEEYLLLIEYFEDIGGIMLPTIDLHITKDNSDLLHGLSLFRMFMNECNIVQFLHDYVENIKLFHCPYYDSFYVTFLIDLVRIKSKDSQVSIITPNELCRNYLASKSGFDVLSLRQAIVQLSTVTSSPNKLVLILDRFHKMGLTLLNELFLLCKSYKQKINITLIGDQYETCSTYQHGGGYIFNDLYWNYNKFQTVRLDWGEVSGDPSNQLKLHNKLSKTYQAIELNYYDSIDQVSISGDNALKDELAEMEKKINLEINNLVRNTTGRKKNMKKNADYQRLVDYYLFCSDNNTKDRLLTVIYAPKSHTYVRRHFYIKYKIYIVETDHIGYLQRAFRMVNGERVPIDSGTEIYVNSGHYIFIVDEVEYDSRHFTFQHASALNINKFCAQPKDYVLFYVTSNTTKTDLLNSIKYATVSVRFLLEDGVNLATIFTKNKISFPKSDFAAKMKTFDPL